MVTILSLFFSLDHQNYARWPPIHIRDLEVLPDSIQVEFDQGYWMITWKNRHFSSIPIDHAHNQANKRVKGVGGMIGPWHPGTLDHDWSHREPWHPGTLDHDWSHREPWHPGTLDHDWSGNQPSHWGVYWCKRQWWWWRTTSSWGWMCISQDQPVVFFQVQR